MELVISESLVLHSSMRESGLNIGTHVKLVNNKSLSGSFLKVAWFEHLCHQIVKLDLSNNGLYRVPLFSLIAKIKTLKFLNLNNNNIIDIEEYDEVDVSLTICDSSLESLDLSNNRLIYVSLFVFQLKKLRLLNVSHNRINKLGECFRTSFFGTSHWKDEWNCPALEDLNVSQNELLELPSKQLRKMVALHRFNVANNYIEEFPPPWDCHLSYLNLSYNKKLSKLPADLNVYWSGSLKHLHLDGNSFEILPNCVVALLCLKELTVSRNPLVKLPEKKAWQCRRLVELDLSDCSLTNARKVGELTNSELEFFEILSFNLTTLSLRGNKLHYVPSSISSLQQLETLDLRKNAEIREIPVELGLCKKLWHLYLSRGQLQQRLLDKFGIHDGGFVDELSEGAGCSACATTDINQCDCLNIRVREMIFHLNAICRSAVPYRRLRVVVLGPPNSSKTSLIKDICCTTSTASISKTKLFCHAGGASSAVVHPEVDDSSDNKGLRIFDWQPSAKILNSAVSSMEDRSFDGFRLTFWVLPSGHTNSADNLGLLAAQQSCFAPNCLYLAVWNWLEGDADLLRLRKYLSSIHVRSLNARVLLVATHMEGEDDEREHLKKQYMEKIFSLFFQSPCYPKISEVEFFAFNERNSLENLRIKVIRAALCLQNVYNYSEFVVGRLVSQKVINLEKKLIDFRDSTRQSGIVYFPILPQDILCAYFKQEEIPTDEYHEVIKFLNETGIILHFEDQLHGLDSLYFFDPEWLFDKLCVIIEEKTLRLNRNRLRHIMLGDMKDDTAGLFECYVEKFVQLVENLDIGISINETELLILFRQPRQPQMHRLRYLKRQHLQSTMTSLFRIYQLKYTPVGFWSRLIARIYTALERFVGALPDRKSAESAPSVLSHQTSSFKRKAIIYRSSVKQRSFLHQQNDGASCSVLHLPVIWREGILVPLADQSVVNGHFIVQSGRQYHQHALLNNECEHDEDCDEDPLGVIISVHADKPDFTIMCALIDEVDTLISDWFVGLKSIQDSSEEKSVQREIPCPVCLKNTAIGMDLENPLSESILLRKVHTFSFEECALAVVRGRHHIRCDRSGVDLPLANLVPELLMADMPPSLLIDPVSFHLDFTDPCSLLGQGAFGSVIRATLNNVVVAAKMTVMPDLLNVVRNEFEFELEIVQSKDSAFDDYPRANFISSQSSKLSNTLRTFKQHMVFDKILEGLAALRHEVQILAALKHRNLVGLLGVCLDPFCFALEYAPMGSLQSILFARGVKLTVHELPLHYLVTYQIAHEVLQALEYLHAQRIIYRDLKSDNLLVFSLDWRALFRVKLSDYGTSVRAGLQGATGLEGTVGYLAPEVASGTGAYDCSVDIFSFGMFLYELLTARRPYDDLCSTGSLLKAVRSGKRPALLGVTKKYLPLATLMIRCWADKTNKNINRGIENIELDMKTDKKTVLNVGQEATILKKINGSKPQRPTASDARKYLEHHEAVMQRSFLPCIDVPTINSSDTFKDAMSRRQIETTLNSVAPTAARELLSKESFNFAPLLPYLDPTLICIVKSSAGHQILLWRDANTDMNSENSSSVIISYQLIDVVTGLVRDERSWTESFPAKVYSLCQVEHDVWVARGPDPEKCSVLIYGYSNTFNVKNVGLQEKYRIDLTFVPTNIYFDDVERVVYVLGMTGQVLAYRVAFLDSPIILQIEGPARAAVRTPATDQIWLANLNSLWSLNPRSLQLDNQKIRTPGPIQTELTAWEDRIWCLREGVAARVLEFSAKNRCLLCSYALWEEKPSQNSCFLHIDCEKTPNVEEEAVITLVKGSSRRSRPKALHLTDTSLDKAMQLHGISSTESVEHQRESSTVSHHKRLSQRRSRSTGDTAICVQALSSNQIAVGRGSGDILLLATCDINSADGEVSHRHGELLARIEPQERFGINTHRQRTARLFATTTSSSNSTILSAAAAASPNEPLLISLTQYDYHIETAFSLLTTWRVLEPEQENIVRRCWNDAKSFD